MNSVGDLAPRETGERIEAPDALQLHRSVLRSLHVAEAIQGYCGDPLPTKT
ncbi:hypothetical protein [Variovorax sp. YR216]|uniref:hypothetical protein n=1 Tax=Variovorax sp. YR216 TaxID=1882828 RepID=UPI00089CBACA|nr:hypothetical protein [Variovorax sp. YR216]SEB22541.1 hypothetical protein SAMN05444680_11676 [Variovorax sp. YR216]